MTSRPALRAAELGLVNRVVGAGALVDARLALAWQVTRHSAAAVGATLRAVHRGLPLPIDEALHVEAAQFMVAADAREGTFLARREPVFRT